MKLRTILIILLVLFTVFTVYLQWHGLHHHGLFDDHGGDYCVCLLFMSMTLFAIILVETVRRIFLPPDSGTRFIPAVLPVSYHRHAPPASPRPGYRHALFCRPPPFFS